MIDIDRFISIIKAEGGLIWSTPNYLNLIGIRDVSKVNTFNDKLIYFWYSTNGKMEVRETKKGFTTDPGLSSLKCPVNSKGCAILKEGWHRKLWIKGKHKGQYDALVQYADCEVYRDNDKDENLDLRNRKLDKGQFGINLHRANKNTTSVQVDNWSAGCQVVADPVEFSQLMDRVDKANKAGQIYFSYMLINKEDWMY